MKRWMNSLSDRAVWWLLHAAIFAITFLALAIRSMWDLPS